MMNNFFMDVSLPLRNVWNLINDPIRMNSSTLRVEEVILLDITIVFFLSRSVLDPVNELLTDMSVVFICDRFVVDSLDIASWSWWSSRRLWTSDWFFWLVVRSETLSQPGFLNTTSLGLPVRSQVSVSSSASHVSSEGSNRSSVSSVKSSQSTARNSSSSQSTGILLTFVPWLWLIGRLEVFLWLSKSWSPFSLSLALSWKSSEKIPNSLSASLVSSPSWTPGEIPVSVTGVESSGDTSPSLSAVESWRSLLW
jgi:hypothetical protein